MARLPQPGGDSGNWGVVLNDYLSQSPKPNGTIKDNVVTAATIQDGTITAAQLDTSVQASLDKADTAAQPADVATKYTKPSEGIPLTDIKRTDLDAAYTVRGRAFYHSMAGATSGMATGGTSFTTDSGHTARWVRTLTNQSINTGSANGKGAFWGVPGSSAAYLCTTDLGANVKHAKMRFLIAAGSGGTGGTACVAVTSQQMVDGLSGQAATSMPCHFWSTPTTWAFTVWTPGTGQVILANGTYATSLIKDTSTEYSLEVWLNGNTAIFIAADGIVRRVTDSRIGAYAGRFAFAESYMPAANDDVICVTSFDCETIGAAEVPQPTSTVGPDVMQAVARSRAALMASPPRIYAAATGSRPTASSAGAGAMMFDTTLGRPIWSDGTNWKDASGTTV